jgi:hypothetical protein
LLLLPVFVCLAATLPPGAKRAGYVISAEGGVDGGTQVLRYDAEGRPLDGSGVAAPKSNRPVAPSSASPSPSASAAPAPAPVNQELRTADGRKVPFSIEGQGPKAVDGTVDFNSALKKVTKSNDSLEKRFDTSMAPIGKEQVYSRNNLLTLESWHGRYDTFGRMKADLTVEDTLGAAVKPKDVMEVKSIERVTSSVSGTKAEVKDWENRMGVESNTRYAGVKSSWDGVLNSGPKTVDQLSMQDINRFQFRRNREDAPGLPVAKPGSDAIQNKAGPK